jgi:uncharacterized protein YycO
MLVPLRFGAHVGTGVVSRLIRWQQRSDVSHISLIDNDNRLIEALEFRGVTDVRTLESVRNEQRVDVFSVMVFPDQQRRAIEWARQQVGKRYDYLSVLRFVTRRDAREHNGKWFCSELAFVAAQQAGVALLERISPSEVSPGHFVMSPLLTHES